MIWRTPPAPGETSCVTEAPAEFTAWTIRYSGFGWPVSSNCVATSVKLYGWIDAVCASCIALTIVKSSQYSPPMSFIS